MADIDTSSYILRYNLVTLAPEFFVGSDWYSITVPPGELTLANTKILVGNGSGIATAVNVSSDATLANTGALTVTSVGGSSAANIHTSQLATAAATDANTASTLVKRDNTGAFAASVLSLSGLLIAPFIVAPGDLVLLGSSNSTSAVKITKQDATTVIAQFNATTLELDMVNNPIVNVGGLAMTGTTTTFQPPMLTDTQMNALVAVEGMVIYNTTQHAPAWYNGTTWKISASV